MTRPLASSLPRQNQVGKIGRRQKRGFHPRWATTSRRSTSHTHQKSKLSIEKNQHPYSPRSRAGEFSVRLGSKISQSQGTQAVSLKDQQYQPRSRRLLSDSLSENSMLLDRCGIIPIASPEKQSIRSVSSQRQPNIRSTSTGPRKGAADAAVPLRLIPLNKARDLNSFDLVLQRSSSVSRTNFLTSTPQQNLVVHTHRTEGTPTSRRNNAAVFHHQGHSSPPATETFLDHHYGLPVPQRGLVTPQILGQTSDMDESQTNSCVPEHRFTIDEQVELETISNNMSPFFSRPVYGRMRPAGCSPVHSRRGSSPVAMTGAHFKEASCARVTPVRASDRFDSGHQEAHSFVVTEQATECFSPATDLDYAQGTDPSLVACHEGDSEAWLRYVFPDDILHHQSKFFFANAPELCPRNQKKDSPHVMSPHNNNGPAKLHHRNSSSIMSKGPNTDFTMNSARNTNMSSPVPQAPCPRTDCLTQPSPMEGYFNEQLANTFMFKNNVGGDWSSGSLPNENLGRQTKSNSALFQTQEESIVPLKMKANDSSKSEYSTQPANKYFKHREKQRSIYYRVPRAALWGTKRDRESETGYQQFLPSQNEVLDHGRGAPSVIGRYQEKARGREDSSLQHFLEDRADRSTKSNLGPETSNDENVFCQYGLTFSPPTDLPPIWNNTVTNDQFHFSLAGSNREPTDQACGKAVSIVPSHQYIHSCE